MPVLPEDDSMIVWPGSRTPSFSASSIIDRAMRSFTEPPGFWPSSFTSRRTDGFGLSELTSSSGVLPIRSRTLPKTVIPERSGAAGDGGQDRDDVIAGDLRSELVQVPRV